ncbi:MAG: hypothetical protein WC781_04360 [Candidatus Pacearchaeota archaeon]|jgi:hypothetical protein
MNKKSLIIIFLAFFLIFSVSAIEITTSKDKFLQGETFQATLSGNILQNIQKSDIGFYRGHVQEPVDFDITKINSTYYIYAMLPYKTEDYSLRIKNVYYKEANSVKIQNLEKNFTITNETAEFNVKPGFIITNKDFTLSIYNNKEIPLAIIYSIENSSFSEMIPAQESKEISVSIEPVKSTSFSSIIISSGKLTYNLPSYILKNTSISQINNSFNYTYLKDDLDFDIATISTNLEKGKSFSYQLKLKNIGSNTSKDIVIQPSSSLEGLINITPLLISSLAANKTALINFTIKINKIGNYSGFIKAVSYDSSSIVAINIKVSQNISQNTTSLNISSSKSCAQLNGKQCQTGKYCSIANIASSDGFCCTGECKDLNSSNTPTERNWLVIWIVIILLVAIAAFFFWKMKNPSVKNPIKEKTKSFEERFETSGKLGKI